MNELSSCHMHYVKQIHMVQFGAFLLATPITSASYLSSLYRHSSIGANHRIVFFHHYLLANKSNVCEVVILVLFGKFPRAKP